MTKMRIVIVTQEEPFYIPPFLERLAQARGSDIVGMIILRPFNESLLDVGKRLYELYGLWNFSVQFARFAWAKLVNLLNSVRPISRPYSVVDVARRYQIPIYKPLKINASEFVQILREEIRPDLLVSVAASQILKKRVLEIPKLGCINVHTAPLPRYQGMLPTFWTMLHGETETAVTVHYMVETLDAGEIILQEPVPIYPEDTQHTLIVRTKQVGVELVLRAIQQIESNTVQSYPMDPAQATYFSFPKRADAERFRALGRRFL